MKSKKPDNGRTQGQECRLPRSLVHNKVAERDDVCQIERGVASAPAFSFAMRSDVDIRHTAAAQSIDGEVVARAEPAIADGEPGFRGRGPAEN